MIFVTVGTQKFSFDRLFRKMDSLAIFELAGKEIFGQIGYSSYEPKNFPFLKFLSEKEYEAYIERADIVIIHSGAGGILNAIKKGKRTIAVPRQPKFGEHVDEHQIEIGKVYSELGYVEMCLDIENSLWDNIKAAESRSFEKYNPEENRIISIIDNWLEKKFQ